jgi:hypothetical protein
VKDRYPPPVSSPARGEDKRNEGIDSSPLTEVRSARKGGFVGCEGIWMVREDLKGVKDV